MKDSNFQIGEKVRWTVGKIESTGCFLDESTDGLCNIVTHTVNGRPTNGLIVQVLKSRLRLDINC